MLQLKVLSHLEEKKQDKEAALQKNFTFCRVAFRHTVTSRPPYAFRAWSENIGTVSAYYFSGTTASLRSQLPVTTAPE
jgi:hypothetical protein